MDVRDQPRSQQQLNSLAPADQQAHLQGDYGQRDPRQVRAQLQLNHHLARQNDGAMGQPQMNTMLDFFRDKPQFQPSQQQLNQHSSMQQIPQMSGHQTHQDLAMSQQNALQNHPPQPTFRQQQQQLMEQPPAARPSSPIPFQMQMARRMEILAREANTAGISLQSELLNEGSGIYPTSAAVANPTGISRQLELLNDGSGIRPTSTALANNRPPKRRRQPQQPSLQPQQPFLNLQLYNMAGQNGALNDFSEKPALPVMTPSIANAQSEYDPDSRSFLSTDLSNLQRSRLMPQQQQMQILKQQQKLKQLMQYASLSVNEMRQRGLPETIVQQVDRSRPLLARLVKQTQKQKLLEEERRVTQSGKLPQHQIPRNQDFGGRGGSLPPGPGQSQTHNTTHFHAQHLIPEERPSYWDQESIFNAQALFARQTFHNSTTADDANDEETRYDFAKLHRHLSDMTNSQPHQQIATTSAVNDSTDVVVQDLRPAKRRRLTDVDLNVLDWSSFLSHNSRKPLGSGGFGDVYLAEWTNLPRLEGKMKPPPSLVVKQFRIAPNVMNSNKRSLKKILREIAVWHKLEHENIVQFAGVINMPDSFPCLVSVRMYNGSINQYILRNPEGTCLLFMILGVIRGLHYLHQQDRPIVHGDMKADNVLVNSRGCPRLCDFGLSRIIDTNSLWNTSASKAPGTQRWMAPELVDESQSTVTTQSDIFAFAMTCYEILTGHIPFPKSRDVAAMMAIIRGERPGRDALCITDNIWMLMQSCWVLNADERLSSSSVVQSLCPHECRESQGQPPCIYRDPIVQDEPKADKDRDGSNSSDGSSSAEA